GGRRGHQGRLERRAAPGRGEGARQPALEELRDRRSRGRAIPATHDRSDYTPAGSPDGTPRFPGATLSKEVTMTTPPRYPVLPIPSAESLGVGGDPVAGFRGVWFPFRGTLLEWPAARPSSLGRGLATSPRTARS